MRLVMTLWVRNEADILDANIAFHLNAGVDFVIATDNGSDDGTLDILDGYQRRGVLHRIDDPAFSQVDAVTRMARLAATELGADWVINNDADEFWWPRGGSLTDVLAAVPERFGCVRGMWRHFVARPATADFFAEGMTVRLRRSVTDRDHAFNAHFKTAHRADPEVTVGGGNHEAYGRDLIPLRNWYPIEVLHFPLRSLEQCERKFVHRAITELQTPRPPDPRRMEAYEAYRDGRLHEFYDSHVVGDLELEQGLRSGMLAIDVRLREALRALRTTRGEDGLEFRLPPDAPPLTFLNPDVDESDVAEIATLGEADELVRLQRRIQRLEARMSARHTAVPARLRSMRARASG
ncbi:MAG TPA: glycosyltransferase family 2 protein [Gaiellaceae bacterium]|nr:glycosyltransferase family 2 protein [Gaiellaceae bacterium]